MKCDICKKNASLKQFVFGFDGRYNYWLCNKCMLTIVAFIQKFANKLRPGA
jgi:hypothetical protein